MVFQDLQKLASLPTGPQGYNFLSNHFLKISPGDLGKGHQLSKIHQTPCSWRLREFRRDASCPRFQEVLSWSGLFFEVICLKSHGTHSNSRRRDQVDNLDFLKSRSEVSHGGQKLPNQTSPAPKKHTASIGCICCIFYTCVAYLCVLFTRGQDR